MSSMALMIFPICWLDWLISCMAPTIDSISTVPFSAASRVAETSALAWVAFSAL